MLKKSNKIKILIATHSFVDSPHCFGNNFFTDHYDWLDSLGKISNEVDYDWYIKCHPNPTLSFDNTIDITKKFVRAKHLMKKGEDDEAIQYFDFIYPRLK